MLHELDDLPVHQTAQPILHPATDSPNAYDRYFYNGYRPDGTFFALAFGVYPNRGVIDAAFGVVVDGVQHAVRASGAAPVDRTRTRVDPIAVTVEAPMRRHRVVVDDRFGVAADLTWTAISPAIEEPRFHQARGTRAVMDLTRFTQFGRWTGGIEVDGVRIDVDGAIGCRDRSWGIRPVGEQPAGPAQAPQFFWIWAPTVFDDVCTHIALNEEADGRPWHASGAVVPRLADGEPPLDPGRVQRATGASVEIAWESGTRWAATVRTRLSMWSADPVVVDYEPVGRFHMSGIGYLHRTWGHGTWRGEADAIRDHVVLAEVDPADPSMIHVQALCRARWGTRTGWGVVEQLAIGPHAPSGLRGVVDGYR